MAIEDDIRKIHNDYPWASEDTLGKIASNTRTENAKLKKVFQSLTGVEFDYDSVKKEFEDAEELFKKTNKLITKMEDGTKNMFSVVSRDTDPLEATAELLKMSVGAISATVGGITSFTQFLGPKAAAVSWVVDGAVGVGVAAVGVAAIYAKLMSEQEKGLRQVIDYGGVVGDMSQYTEMRGSLAGVGMSMQEMTKVMNGNKAMLANLPDGLMNTTKQFIDFSGKVESETSKTMGDFGYGVEQMTTRLLEEANLMYMSGELEQFGQLTKDKIRKNFESSSAMTTFLAEKFGSQRSALLAMRSEAMTNIDFMTAMSMNGEYLAKTYGENAAENVKNTGANIKMLFSTVLGPQFGEQTEQVFNNMLKDINIDASVLNNMPTDMINMLSTLGPEVSTQFKDIMEQAGTGKLSQPELVMKVKELTTSISMASPRYGDDPIVQQSNDLIAQARIAPEAFMDLTVDQLDAGLESVKSLTEQADSSIDAIDAARVGFRTVVNELTPGYALGATAVKGFSGALGLVQSAFEFIGLIKTEDKPIEPEVTNPGANMSQKMMSNGGAGSVVTDENYDDMSDNVKEAYDAYKKAQTLKQKAAYANAYTNAYNILNKNFSPGQFAEGGGPVPIQRPNGRWYANIKDPNSPIGSKKVYVDELNVVGMKFNNMHQLDSMIGKKIKEITEVIEKTAVTENMNGG